MQLLFKVVILSLLITSSCNINRSSITKAVEEWQPLVDADLTHWDIFMGVPHPSSEIAGYEDVKDVRFGTPIGLNKDPREVFSVIQEDGEDVIKITGEVFAGLVTKEEYADYHLKAQFKWGDKKWAPRLDQKRNSGILYHSVGDYTDFWNVWMSSLEFEVQESDCGDFITISETSVKASTPAIKKENGKYYFAPGAELVEMSWRKDVNVTGRCWKNGDPELPHGEWNTLELICLGDQAIHIVNGVVVMTVHQPMYLDQDRWQPLSRGKIQIQSEAAEIYYKDIKIKSLNALPSEYLNYVRK